MFSGEIWGTSKKGDVTLHLRSGMMIRPKKGMKQEDIPLIELAGIPEAFSMGDIFRRRIKENDPTPVRQNK